MKSLALLIPIALAACSTDDSYVGPTTVSSKVAFKSMKVPSGIFATPLDIADRLTGNFPEEAEGNQRLNVHLIKNPADAATMILLVTAEGGLDDSIDGEQSRAIITRDGDGWRVVSLGQRWLCGRGPDLGRWGARLCP